VLDTPLETPVDATMIPDMVVTLSDRHTSLSGTLHTSAPRAGSDYFIVVYPVDRSLQHAPLRIGGLSHL
jgi:hypothetical protein